MRKAWRKAKKQSESHHSQGQIIPPPGSVDFAQYPGIAGAAGHSDYGRYHHDNSPYPDTERPYPQRPVAERSHSDYAANAHPSWQQHRRQYSSDQEQFDDYSDPYSSSLKSWRQDQATPASPHAGSYTEPSRFANHASSFHTSSSYPGSGLSINTNIMNSGSYHNGYNSSSMRRSEEDTRSPISPLTPPTSNSPAYMPDHGYSGVEYTPSPPYSSDVESQYGGTSGQDYQASSSYGSQGYSSGRSMPYPIQTHASSANTTLSSSYPPQSSHTSHHHTNSDAISPGGISSYSAPSPPYGHALIRGQQRLPAESTLFTPWNGGNGH